MAGSVDALAEWVCPIHFDELDSTQKYVERECASFDQGKLTVVSADFQNAGRGTGERTWCATQGQSALMTFYFTFPSSCSNDFVNRNAPNVTQVLASCAVNVLTATAMQTCASGVASCRFGVKWPNDVVVNDHKIGGVLARALFSAGRLDRIIAGIGVNINTSQADLDEIKRPVWPATSLQVVTGRTHDVGAFRRDLSLAFAGALQTFFVSGFASFRESLGAMDVFVGRSVTFRIHETAIEGTYLGTNEEGHILLRTEGGVQAYPSGEIICCP